MVDDQSPRPWPQRPLPSAALLGVLMLVTGCVQWQSVPIGDVGARPLPRWVQLTTRDSVHYALQGAHLVRGDTLVGRSADARQDQSPVRLPLADVAHLEARLPSGAGSIGVGALVVGGVAGLVALIGHASTW